SFVLVIDAQPARGDRAQGIGIYPLPKAEEIGDLVSALTEPETLALAARARTLGKDGYDLLLAPIAERIKGKDLLIVPGEALCLLPFELLVEDGNYLIENHQIRYAPSMTA